MIVIPDLIDGVLPEGVHQCTMDEVEARFGTFRRTDRRVRLMERLRAYFNEVRLAGIASAVILDGSYVTDCEEPNDIDLILVLRPGVSPAAELRPFQYNVVSKRRVRKQYGFDAFALDEQSRTYQKMMDYFSDVRAEATYTSRARKGHLRIIL